MRTALYLALAFIFGIALGGASMLYRQMLKTPNVPIPPISVQAEVVEPSSPRPPSLDELQVTVLRVGMDVTLLLDWERRDRGQPFHIWIEVDGSDVVLRSVGDTPRRIQIVPDATLHLFGSTLYHERGESRLAIDLQVSDVRKGIHDETLNTP